MKGKLGRAGALLPRRARESMVPRPELGLFTVRQTVPRLIFSFLFISIFSVKTTIRNDKNNISIYSI